MVRHLLHRTNDVSEHFHDCTYDKKQIHTFYFIERNIFEVHRSVCIILRDGTHQRPYGTHNTQGHAQNSILVQNT